MDTSREYHTEKKIDCPAIVKNDFVTAGHKGLSRSTKAVWGTLAVRKKRVSHDEKAGRLELSSFQPHHLHTCSLAIQESTNEEPSHTLRKKNQCDQ